MAKCGIGALPENPVLVLAMFTNAYDLAALSVASRGTRKLLRSRVIWAAVLQRDYGLCLQSDDPPAIARHGIFEPTQPRTAPMTTMGLRRRHTKTHSCKAAFNEGLQAEAQHVKHLKQRYYEEWLMRKQHAQELANRDRVPWIETLLRLKETRPRNLPANADWLRVVLDIVFYIVPDPCLFGFLALGVYRMARILDGDSYRDSTFMLEVLICHIGPLLWLAYIFFYFLIQDNSYARLDTMHAQHAGNGLSAIGLFVRWLKRGSAVTYRWQSTAYINEQAFVAVSRNPRRRNPEEVLPVLCVTMAWNWILLLSVCSSVETNLVGRMSNWSYIVQGIAYLAHGAIIASVSFYFIGWDWVRRLQLGRFAEIIRAAIGATLIGVVVFVVGLQRWIFCHVESYTLNRDELSTAQLIDQWLIDAYEFSKEGIYNASIYVVHLVWESNNTAVEMPPLNATESVSQIGYNWHWRYTNETAFCANGEGLSGVLFSGMPVSMASLCSILAFFVLLWWCIRMMTLQWKWRLTVQHIASNCVDVVTAPLILMTLKRLCDCEGTAAEVQKTGIFQRDLNDESLSPTWEGCTKASVRPLMLCLGLLAVRGCIRGCALLMEARRIANPTHLRRSTSAYAWLYPAWLLAWGRVICTGTRARPRRNPLDAPLRR